MSEREACLHLDEIRTRNREKTMELLAAKNQTFKGNRMDRIMTINLSLHHTMKKLGRKLRKRGRVKKRSNLQWP